MTAAIVPIPQPKPVPLLGNLPDVDAEKGILGFMELAERLGPIYRLQLPSTDLVVVGSQELVDELCDESRFDKSLSAALVQVRDFAGDGLFTSWTEEANWGKAHRILMPAFGPAALRTMFDGMVDIADQLLLKWERQGPNHLIDVADNTTRLTLDTIALCSFGYRFNSMYTEAMHPFVGAMVRALVEAGERTVPAAAADPADVGGPPPVRRGQAADVRDRRPIDQRPSPQPAPDGQHDILDTMLTATRPEDRRAAVRRERALPAGHVPHRRARDDQRAAHLHPLPAAAAPEDPGPGPGGSSTTCSADRAPRFADLAELGYLDQILKESLRLWPTAPAFALRCLRRRDDDRRPLPGAARADCCWCSSRSCTATPPSGVIAPRSSTPTASPSTGPSSCRRTPGSRSATASAPASGAVSRCRRPPCSWP